MSPHGIWPAVLGRFDWQAFPFVRAWEHPTISEIIGAGAASMVLIGALLVVALITWLGRWRYLWVRVGDQPRSQEDWHHVCRAGPGDA